MISATRESVNGAVTGLQNRGTVTMRQERISVLNPEAGKR